MKECPNCKAQINDEDLFCKECGYKFETEVKEEETEKVQETEATETPAAIETPKQEEKKTEEESWFDKFTDTPKGEGITEEDAKENNGMVVLCYLSWLLLIPLLARKESKYLRYHCNQGLTLAILETACGLVLGLLSLIPYVGWLFTLILSVLELGFLFLTVIGIINGVTCKARQLPIIGKYTLLKDVK